MIGTPRCLLFSADVARLPRTPRHGDRGGAGPFCPEHETADLLWYWFGPMGWHALVVESGWTWDRAEEFLHRTAVRTLFP